MQVTDAYLLDTVSPMHNLNPFGQTTENPKQKHAKHNVLSIATGTNIVSQMVLHAPKHGDDVKIASSAVSHLPLLFLCNTSSNLSRASQQWNSRKEYPTCGHRGSLTVTTCFAKDRPRTVRMKARHGRVRCRLQWVDSLQNDVRSERDRLQKLVCKINITSLLALSLNTLKESNNEAYNGNMIDPSSSRQLCEKANMSWVQSFMERLTIVSEAHTGKHHLVQQRRRSLRNQFPATWKITEDCSKWNSGQKRSQKADEKHFFFNLVVLEHYDYLVQMIWSTIMSILEVTIWQW